MIIFICNDCGHIGWFESTNEYRSYSYSINPETLKLEEESENNELFENEVMRTCEECNSEDLVELETDDLKKREFKRIIKMNDAEKLNWLKRHLTLEKLAN